MSDTRTVRTSDGVDLATYHDPGPESLAFIALHGFTGSANSPGMRLVRAGLSEFGGVVAIDLRGHGNSGGESTVGDREVSDVSAGIRQARDLGYLNIVTIGFSMGASIVVRHAGLLGEGISGVVSVSGPAFWHYRGTPPMRLVHHTIGTAAGRALAKAARGTRIAATGWDPEPASPVVAAAGIEPIPFLIVHGDADSFFPLEHPQRLADAAPHAQLWVEPGFGHAEGSVSSELIRRIGLWATALPGNRPGPGVVGPGMGDQA